MKIGPDLDAASIYIRIWYEIKMHQNHWNLTHATWTSLKKHWANFQTNRYRCIYSPIYIYFIPNFIFWNLLKLNFSQFTWEKPWMFLNNANIFDRCWFSLINKSPGYTAEQNLVWVNLAIPYKNISYFSWEKLDFFGMAQICAIFYDWIWYLRLKRIKH